MKRSGGLKSGERGGHSTGPIDEAICCGSILSGRPVVFPLFQENIEVVSRENSFSTWRSLGLRGPNLQLIQDINPPLAKANILFIESSV
jgi:hypothetical protein